MQKYFKQSSPVIIPTDDNKKIAEFVGLTSTGNKGLSLACMLAPLTGKNLTKFRNLMRLLS